MLPWIQKEEYLKNVGYLPKEYEIGSEGYKQFSYNPRTKESREYLASLGFRKIDALKSKPKKKSYSKKKA